MQSTVSKNETIEDKVTVNNDGYEITTDSLCRSFNYPIDSLFFNKYVLSDYQNEKWKKEDSERSFTLEQLTSRIEFASGRAVIELAVPGEEPAGDQNTERKLWVNWGIFHSIDDKNYLDIRGQYEHLNCTLNKEPFEDLINRY